ncbi:MAG: hypothetical protein IIW48_09375 [Clostridia bacterium]|nr:hypothetical protein [Clostridia bacterium]
MRSYVTEDTVKITKYDVAGKLPDPFVFDDGSRVSTREDWFRRRKEMYKNVIELQYGTMPPEPEFVEVEKLSGWGGTNETYRVTSGTMAHPVSFTMYIKGGCVDEKRPAVIDGDLCFGYPFDKEFISTFTDKNIMLVLFNRVELANDVQHEGRGHGPLYDAYPDCTFGALGAWAWGYSRCVDALELLGYADMDCITFTGHSRGGKTAALAGVLDERAAIVNPNETCAGSCSCYRINIEAVNENGEEKRSESLRDIWHNFPFWFGPELGEYADRVDELPFDCHFLKAMIAPRVLFVSEAASDIWGNPVGSWQTTMAAKEVYKFLGVPDNLLWYFRNGTHFHQIEDIDMLTNVIMHYKNGEELYDNYSRVPFEKSELIFDWKCPDIEG